MGAGHTTVMGVSTQLVLVQVVELTHLLLDLAQVALPTKTNLKAPLLELTHLPQVVLPMKTSHEATLTAELTHLHLDLAQAIRPTMTSHTDVAEPGLRRLPLVQEPIHHRLDARILQNPPTLALHRSLAIRADHRRVVLNPLQATLDHRSKHKPPPPLIHHLVLTLPSRTLTMTKSLILFHTHQLRGTTTLPRRQESNSLLSSWAEVSPKPLRKER